MIYSYGSKERELQRTAEMFLDLCGQEKFCLALWLIYDSNRFDEASLKFLCNEVQKQEQSLRSI